MALRALIALGVALPLVTAGIDLTALACAQNGSLPYCNHEQTNPHPERKAVRVREATQEQMRDYRHYLIQRGVRNEQRPDTTPERYEQDRAALMGKLHEMRTRGKQGRLEPFASIVAVPDDVKRQLAIIANAVERTRRNPFEDSDLRETEGDDKKEAETEGDSVEGITPVERARETEISEFANHREHHVALKEQHHAQDSHESVKAPAESTVDDSFTSDGFLLYKGASSEYCTKYRDHFAYFCVGGETNGAKETVQAFCPSFSKACGVAAPAASTSSSSSSQSTWPSNPFTKEITVNAAPTSKEVEDAEVEHKRKQLAAIKKKFPCTPDCDARIFKHCTASCKCEYLFPTVQRFCNPPPLPLFLNTCRLWYHGCPQFDQYHYASQFVYSKAEKGKVVAGPVRNPNPFGLPTAPKLPDRVARGTPIREQSLSSPTEGFIPQDRIIDGPSISATATNVPTNKQRSGLLFVPPDLPDHAVLGRVKDDPGREHNHTNSRRSNDFLVIPPEPKSERSSGHARALQSRSFPVVPSDAAFGANPNLGQSGGDVSGTGSGNVFNQFDGLTDSRGILHRPRSRSPFTKPGLWEPNPDDPHNRDHANKWWYHPDSVTADWLNGQVNWGAHWAVPAAGVGGTDGYSALHFPSIGTFLNIPDDYDT